MVRTKADRIQKAVGSKAPAKNVASAPSPVTPSRKVKGRNYVGGNPYHPRETPEWQKPITNFLNPDSVYGEVKNDTPSPNRVKPSASITSKIQELCDDEDDENDSNN